MHEVEATTALQVERKGNPLIWQTKTVIRHFKTLLRDMHIDRKQCIVCNNDHKLFLCKTFRSFSVTDRIKTVNDHKLCKICLANNHSTEMCKSNYRCNVEHCEGKHSKLIHANVSVSNNHCFNFIECTQSQCYIDAYC